MSFKLNIIQRIARGRKYSPNLLATDAVDINDKNYDDKVSVSESSFYFLSSKIIRSPDDSAVNNDSFV